MEIKTIVQVKRHIIGTNIFCIIISKFDYRKEPGPIVLFVMNKSLEISLYYIILLFNLAINLKIKNYGEPLLDLK